MTLHEIVTSVSRLAPDDRPALTALVLCARDTLKKIEAGQCSMRQATATRGEDRQRIITAARES